jgi:hypothetical protein
MRLWKKIVLAILVLVLLSQLPFAYRLYKLQRLHSAIVILNSQRGTDQIDDGFTDYRGIIHVHTSLGGHSSGNLADVVRAARATGLAFVVMTEHPSEFMDTSEMTLNGVHGGVVFINGNEVVTANHDRFLVIPGAGLGVSGEALSDEELINHKSAAGGLALVAYPEDFQGWNVEGYDGMEVYNLYTNARKIRPITMFFDGLWFYWSYPELLFSRFYQRPSENLEKWDKVTSGSNRRVVATAGSDAHANIGFGLGDSTGKKWLGLQLDPYERVFKIVQTHVLIPKETPISAGSLLNAIAGGHCFISFDLFQDGTGFSFSADNGTEKKMMGDEISLSDGVRLTVSTPVKTRIRIIRNGELNEEQSDVTRHEFVVQQKGVYRIEAYLDQLPMDEKLWIISNPIYVR